MRFAGPGLFFLQKTTLKSLRLEQQTPTFLVPGTSLVGGDFSMDVEVWEEADGFGMMQVRYIYCALYFYSYYIVIYNELRQ